MNVEFSRTDENHEGHKAFLLYLGDKLDDGIVNVLGFLSKVTSNARVQIGDFSTLGKIDNVGVNALDFLVLGMVLNHGAQLFRKLDGFGEAAENWCLAFNYGCERDCHG